MNVEALYVAATPLCVFVGAAVAYYAATESGDSDPVPHPRRGETDWEPWGTPQPMLRQPRLPGDSIVKTKAYGDTGYIPRIPTRGDDE